jgi:hypothetical protein
MDTIPFFPFILSTQLKSSSVIKGSRLASGENVFVGNHYADLALARSHTIIAIVVDIDLGVYGCEFIGGARNLKTIYRNQTPPHTNHKTNITDAQPL